MSDAVAPLRQLGDKIRPYRLGLAVAALATVFFPLEWTRLPQELKRGIFAWWYWYNNGQDHTLFVPMPVWIFVYGSLAFLAWNWAMGKTAPLERFLVLSILVVVFLSPTLGIMWRGLIVRTLLGTGAFNNLNASFFIPPSITRMTAGQVLLALSAILAFPYLLPTPRGEEKK